MNESAPILEFDPAPRAIIEPCERIKPLARMPEGAVICFFNDAIAALRASGELVPVSVRRSEIGGHPIYALERQGRRLGLFHPGVGAPLAAALLEEAIALGGRRFIACGSAGALDGALTPGQAVLPLSAVRDEGVSYHYAPPSREIAPTDAALNALRRTLQARGEPFAAGKTWTTDAFYRETPARVARRRGEGCLTVEMESAAFFAVARFRGVEFAQLLYAEDDVASEVWSSRRKAFDRKAVRARMLELAIEACLAMESGFERARGTA